MGPKGWRNDHVQPLPMNSTMAATRVQSLPVVLYRDIVDRIYGKSDLLPLLWCCSTFRLEAQRLLYRHIVHTKAPTK